MRGGRGRRLRVAGRRRTKCAACDNDCAQEGDDLHQRYPALSALLAALRNANQPKSRHGRGPSPQTGSACPQIGSILIANHPATAVQIAHAVRIDAAASGVERPLPLVARDHVFLATCPARVPVTVKAAPIGNRNCQRDLPSVDGSKRRRFCTGDQPSGCRRERDTSFYFSHFATSRIGVRKMIVA